MACARRGCLTGVDRTRSDDVAVWRLVGWAWAWARPGLLSGGCRGCAEAVGGGLGAVELEQVVGHAGEDEFGVGGGLSAAAEAAEAGDVFDLAVDGFDGGAAAFVEGAAVWGG